jgi:hypothetical protein
MDIRQILSLGLFLLSKVRVPQTTNPPPEPDIVQLYNDARTSIKTMPVVPPLPSLSLDTPISIPSEPPSSEDSVSTACVPCLRAHIAAAAGFLTEALRMARGDGLTNPEVADRINLAEGEIVSAERVDLSPEAILRAPPEEKAVIDWFLPRVRELRQHIITISSLDDLLNASAEANALGRELTLRHLESKGVNIQGVVDIAKKVNDGVMTLDQAKEQVKGLLPVGGGNT